MQIPDNAKKQSITWKTSINFVALATLIVVSIGYLSSVGLLPINETVEFEGSGLQFIRVWLKCAIAIGLVLPFMAFIFWLQRPEPRRIFGFYLLILVIQIMAEQFFSGRWMPSLVVPLGTIYTTFRIWQLWQGIQLVQSAKRSLPRYELLSGVLWMVLCFWLCNIVVLLVIGWASIL